MGKGYGWNVKFFFSPSKLNFHIPAIYVGPFSHAPSHICTVQWNLRTRDTIGTNDFVPCREVVRFSEVK